MALALCDIWIDLGLVGFIFSNPGETRTSKKNPENKLYFHLNSPVCTERAFPPVKQKLFWLTGILTRASDTSKTSHNLRGVWKF